MRWLSRLLGAANSTLSPDMAQRLDAWHALPAADLGKPMAEARYVVVDVETSGLHLARDRLIAIGAVAVDQGRISLHDSLEMVLQQDRISDKGNILIHGISGDVQREGVAPEEGLLNFLEFIGKDPLIAFHAPFDSAMIGKAVRKYLGFQMDAAWLDLAHLAPALVSELPQINCSLDSCAAHFGIENFSRHSALSDAFATAELLLALGPRMMQQKLHSFRQIQQVAAERQRACSLL